MIDLSALEKEYQFKLGSKVITVREPTVKESFEYEKQYKSIQGDPDSELEALQSYLDMLGFEKKELENLKMAQLQKVMEVLAPEKK